MDVGEGHPERPPHFGGDLLGEPSVDLLGGVERRQQPGSPHRDEGGQDLPECSVRHEGGA